MTDNFTARPASTAARTTPPGSLARGAAPSQQSACWHLFLLTLKRQFFSRQTLVALSLSALSCVIIMAWSRHPDPDARKFAEQIVVPLYVVFLMPILAICYGSSVIGGEREDGTLIYLLMSPIPRPWVYTIKFLAGNVLVAGWSLSALLLMCLLGGASGRDVLPVFFSACLLGSIGYSGLFLGLGVLFRHGTIISLAYWFFLEVLFGNMPGIIKRVSVAYYVRCMVYDAGSAFDIGPRGRVARETFLAISGQAAAQILSLGIAVLFLVGLVSFWRREFRDLN
ncbi:MAG: ABC transporter permease subunit [Planctomycetes bacterium]|nr:ABC transporter permease subunit [Planctomycetota bacterium]